MISNSLKALTWTCMLGKSEIRCVFTASFWIGRHRTLKHYFQTNISTTAKHCCHYRIVAEMLCGAVKLLHKLFPTNLVSEYYHYHVINNSSVESMPFYEIRQTVVCHFGIHFCLQRTKFIKLKAVLVLRSRPETIVLVPQDAYFPHFPSSHAGFSVSLVFLPISLFVQSYSFSFFS